MRRKIGYATAAIFRSLASGNRFGLDVMRETDLPSGTVYPTLTRAEAGGLVRGRWESKATATAEGRPRRRYYELTAEGERTLEEALVRFGRLAGVPKRSRSRS